MLQEAMTKENFERIERGERPIKPKVVHKPDPKKPKVENEIKVKDIPDGHDLKLEQAFRKVEVNEDGVRFVGYEVLIELTPVQKENAKGRPPEPKTLKGWMVEGEFLQMLRSYSKQIDRQVIRW